MRDLLLLVALIGVLLAVIAHQYRGDFRERRIEAANWQLHRAVAAGNQRAVDDALAAGADVRATHFLTTFLLAVARNDVGVARSLLEAGADPNVGQPLAKSLANASEEMLDLLLAHGANPKGLALTPLLLSDAPHERKLRMLQTLKHRGVAIQPEELSAAMDQALIASEPAACDFLVQIGAPYTAREAAAFDRLEDVRRLVRENPNVLNEEFPEISLGPNPSVGAPARASTLLGVAGARGSPEMVDFLIESGARADRVRYGPYGETLLHRAAHRAHPELIQLLVERGLDINACDDEQDTPLHEAAIGGDAGWADAATVANLIELGADVNAENHAQWTPLMVAAARHYRHVVQLLLGAGADPTRANNAGQTARDIARERGSTKVLELLETRAPASHAATR
jgi:ankyrin repeat protein